jgi:hypothetical protein
MSKTLFSNSTGRLKAFVYSYSLKRLILLVYLLIRFITAMSKYNNDCCESMKAISDIFPIEVDLPSTLITESQRDSEDDDEDLIEADKGTARQDNVVDDLIGIN